MTQPLCKPIECCPGPRVHAAVCVSITWTLTPFHLYWLLSQEYWADTGAEAVLSAVV